jgi:hypothetical protein
LLADHGSKVGENLRFRVQEGDEVRGKPIHELAPEGEEVKDVDTIKECIKGLFEVIFWVTLLEISEAASVAVVTEGGGVN